MELSSKGMATKSTIVLVSATILIIVYVSLFSVLQHSGTLRDGKPGQTDIIRYFDTVEAAVQNQLLSEQAMRSIEVMNAREKRNILMKKQQEEDKRNDVFEVKDFKENKNDAEKIEEKRDNAVKVKKLTENRNDTQKIEEKIETLPIIHVITPTYKRLNQIPELTRVSNTFKNVKALHWIVVEEGNKTLPEVQNLLSKSGINFTYINAKPYRNTSIHLKGIHQRNAAIFWLRKHVDLSKDGVVYFADDDNTYDLELFNEMRFTNKISVWPVGFVSRRKYQTPILKDGKVVKFNSWNTGKRKFPIDMAGFALNTKLFHYNPRLYFWKTFSIGYQETQFLEICCSLKDLEPKAAGCTKVLVWHTKARDPIIEHTSYNDTDPVPIVKHDKDLDKDQKNTKDEDDDEKSEKENRQKMKSSTKGNNSKTKKESKE